MCAKTHSTHREHLPRFLVWTLVCHLPVPCSSIWVDGCCCRAVDLRGQVLPYTVILLYVCVCVWHPSFSLTGSPHFLFPPPCKHTHTHHLCLTFCWWRCALCSNFHWRREVLEKSGFICFAPHKEVHTFLHMHNYTYKLTTQDTGMDTLQIILILRGCNGFVATVLEINLQPLFIPPAGRWWRRQRWILTCVLVCTQDGCCVACWASGNGSMTSGQTMSHWRMWWRLEGCRGQYDWNTDWNCILSGHSTIRHNYTQLDAQYPSNRERIQPNNVCIQSQS